MNKHRLLIAIEAIVIVIPGVLLSIAWFILWMANIIESLGVINHKVISFYYSLTMIINLILSIFCVMATLSLLYACIIYFTIVSFHKLKYANKLFLLIKIGIVIAMAGLIVFIINLIFGLKSEFFQVLVTYCIGSILLIPSLHILLLNNTNK